MLGRPSPNKLQTVRCTARCGTDVLRHLKLVYVHGRHAGLVSYPERI
jgi:hypothetical protein